MVICPFQKQQRQSSRMEVHVLEELESILSSQELRLTVRSGSRSTWPDRQLTSAEIEKFSVCALRKMAQEVL